MVHELDETSVWTDPVYAPDNGAAATADNFDIPTTALAQRTSYLKTGLDAITPMVINNLSNGYRIFSVNALTVASQASVSSSSKTPTSFSPALSTTIDAVAGDVLSINIGPIIQYCASLVSTSGLLLAIAEGANPPVTKYLIGSGIVSDPVFSSMDWAYTVQAGTIDSPVSVGIILYVVSDGSNAITALTSEAIGDWDASAGTFSITSYTWGQLIQYRPII